MICHRTERRTRIYLTILMVDVTESQLMRNVCGRVAQIIEVHELSVTGPPARCELNRVWAPALIANVISMFRSPLHRARRWMVFGRLTVPLELSRRCHWKMNKPFCQADLHNIVCSAEFITDIFKYEIRIFCKKRKTLFCCLCACGVVILNYSYITCWKSGYGMITEGSHGRNDVSRTIAPFIRWVS